MAKGNMLLGMNRGKLGDIVFKRLNGQSVQVPRVRNPKNPRTDAQTIQRIAFSSASKTAQALRGIVDHSFQGIKYGQTSVNHFVSRLTKEIAESTMSAMEDTSVTPFGTAPIIPLSAGGIACGARALISSGDLKGIAFEINDDSSEGGIIIQNASAATSVLANATVADFESIFGVPYTDQVTIIEGVPEELDYISETELFYGVRFGIARFNIKEGIDPTRSLFQVSSGDVYTFNPAVLDMERTDDVISTMEITAVTGGYNLCGADNQTITGLGDSTSMCLAGIIVSRYENGVWRRSTSRLVRTTKSVTQDAVHFCQEYGYNDIASVLALTRTDDTPTEDEYLNKKKREVM